MNYLAPDMNSIYACSSGRARFGAEEASSVAVYATWAAALGLAGYALFRDQTPKRQEPRLEDYL